MQSDRQENLMAMRFRNYIQGTLTGKDDGSPVVGEYRAMHSSDLPDISTAQTFSNTDLGRDDIGGSGKPCKQGNRTGERCCEVRDSQMRPIGDKVRIAATTPLDCFGRLSSIFLGRSSLSCSQDRLRKAGCSLDGGVLMGRDCYPYRG